MKRWLVIVGLCSCSAGLYGSVVFTLGNNPQPDEHGVLLNNGTSGNTVFGTLNGVPGVNVQFSSTQTLFEPTAGLARITVNPDTTALENVTISVVGGTFGDVIFNAAIGTVGNAGGTAHVTVNSVDNLGNPEVPSPFDYSLSNGQNFLTITTMGGEKIVDMTINYPSGFTDLQGVRISAVTAVPEPSTFVPLLAVAFGSITLIRKTRNV